MVLYRALSRCGSILQGVRALRCRRKDYTTEEIVLGPTPVGLAYRWWSPSPRNPLSILVGSSGFQ